MSPVFGYWNIRGLGQPIRLLLAYTETEFVYKPYREGPPPDYHHNQWLNDKWELGLDFPNLPYYLEGSVKLSQSVTIIRYIARKNRLDGQTEEEKQRIDLTEQQLKELNNTFLDIVYDRNFKENKDNKIKNLSQELVVWENFLDDRPFFAAFEIFDKIRVLSPETLTKMTKLNQFHTRIANLPQIAQFMKTSPKLAITGPMSWSPVWGFNTNFYG